MSEQTVDNPLYQRDGRPSFAKAVPMALQHVVAMVVGCVTMPMIIAATAGVSAADQIIMVQASLFAAALAIILQSFGVKGVFSSGLPVMVGSGFAFLPTLRMIVEAGGVGAMAGAQIAGACVGIAVGLCFKKIRFLFPPIVTASVVLTIGISLYTTAVNYMAGGTPSDPMFGSMRNWALAMITLVTVIICGQFFKGLVKASATLIGMATGYIAAMAMGLIQFGDVSAAGWLQIPAPFHFAPEFSLSAVISLGIVFMVNAVQDIGQFEATSNGVYEREAQAAEITGGVIGNNLCSLLAGVLGGMPVATAGQNVGIVVTTKVINRMVFGIAGAIVMAAALIPKLSALFITIPLPVLGGATITVFGSIAMTGVRMLARDGLSPRSMFISGLSIALAIGIPRVNGVFAGFPSWFGQIFGSSEVIIAAITAVLLNLLLPKEKKEI
ncbi:purine/pyrimidine permease [Tyzzerella sp. OttesenSCG-928-J15]|nr:purine/pyrimidine permease [Tyzzerella sp. OttesenSCG-928-J15]